MAGVTVGPVGTIVSVILVAMVLMIGVVVFANFEGNIDTSGLSTGAQNAINKTAQQTYNGFSLGSMIPYVLFAVAIIVILVGAFLRLV